MNRNKWKIYVTYLRQETRTAFPHKIFSDFSIFYTGVVRGNAKALKHIPLSIFIFIYIIFVGYVFIYVLYNCIQYVNVMPLTMYVITFIYKCIIRLSKIL